MSKSRRKSKSVDTADKGTTLFSILLVLLTGLVVFELARFTNAFGGYLPSDDAYITLRYAKNFLTDFSFSYNLGEPSIGTTSPAYMVVLAGVQAVVKDWYHSVFVLGWITFFGALSLGAACLWRLSGRWAALAFIAFFGLYGRFAFWALFGMEPLLFLCAFLAVWWVYLGEPSVRRFCALGGLLGRRLSLQAGGPLPLGGGCLP